MYFEFMKNFLLANSGEQMPVRLIFGLLSPKTFDSYFLDLMSFEFMKIFFSPIPASRCLLHSFRPPEPKNV